MSDFDPIEEVIERAGQSLARGIGGVKLKVGLNENGLRQVRVIETCPSELCPTHESPDKYGITQIDPG